MPEYVVNKTNVASALVCSRCDTPLRIHEISVMAWCTRCLKMEVRDILVILHCPSCRMWDFGNPRYELS